MENETKKDHGLLAGVLIFALILASVWFYTPPPEVALADGFTLPITWGDLGVELMRSGVIDVGRFKADELLLGQNKGKLKITKDNAAYLLNLFWAFGLANKNPILESGEMANPAYGGAQNFASTGGWTLTVGNPMDHYGKHTFVVLTSDEQALVDKVSSGIYRPCCGNSAHFPDCNHGMAMLGLLELMASQGVSEQEMWKTALAVNSYWFPDTYLAIATYMANRGVVWKDVDPQEMLSADYSSAQGYAQIASLITPSQGGQSGCSV